MYTACLKLAVKDAFSKTIFEEIDVILKKISPLQKKWTQGIRNNIFKNRGNKCQNVTLQNYQASSSAPWNNFENLYLK